MVWIVDYDDTSSGVHNTTVWDDEKAAKKDVCACIVDDINDGCMDFSDQDQYDMAKEIDAAIAAKDYDHAIALWNDWSSSYQGEIYWSVEESNICGPGDAADPGTIAFPIDAEEDDDDQAPATQASGPYQATAPGATCRGPCGLWNDYAYADRPDGTHLCYQCKTFSQIFGTKTP